MPCDTRLKRGQTIQQRATEVRRAVDNTVKAIIAGRVKPRVGATGGITFVGLTEDERDGVTDACMYRRLLSSGSATALQAIARAEALAGRSIDKKAITTGGGGLHSHDSGKTWHGH